jgi:hypothetical protein
MAFCYSAAHATLLVAANESESPRQQTKPAHPAPRQSSEERLWQIAVDSDKAGAYDAYLRKYPNGRYAAVARARLESMDAGGKDTTPRQAAGDEPEQTPSTGMQHGLSAEDELWKAATASGSAGDYQAYLREYPEGRYAAIARSQLGSASATSGTSPSSQSPTAHEAAARESSRPSSEEEFSTSATSAPGTGKTIRFGDQTMTGNFSSDPRTGKVSGTGNVVWTNGNRFEGTLVRGVKEGKGRFIWNNGQRYIGDWANDQPNGKGTLFFPNGDRYEGDVKDGQAHGQGIARFNGGDSYAGHWANGKRHGIGRYTWMQGGYWEGEFRNGDQTDNGTMMRTHAAASGDSSLPLENKAEGSAFGRRP